MAPTPRVFRGGPDVAIAKGAFKQVRLGATVCAVAFGATVASSAVTYVSSFPTMLSRRQLAATTGRDEGLSVLLGPVRAIGTVGGYTFYKVYVFLTVIGAIWAMLAATRLLRGEEEVGRFQLVLAGSTRPARATAATIAALFAAIGVIFAGTAAFTLVAGRDAKVGFGTNGSLIFGMSLAIAPAVFVGVGAVASQLCRTRRGATGLAGATVAVAFVVRMVADSGRATKWMLWATPFGWIERMQPLTHEDLRPLIPSVVSVIGLCAAAVVLASKRDAGDGILASQDVARLRPFGLGSAFGLSARRELPVLAAWCGGLLAMGVMFGTIAKVTTAALPRSFNDTLAKFGVHGSPSAQYFGVVFLLVASVVALLPAGQIGAAGEEETSGRLVHVLVRATPRTSWFAGRLVLGAGAILLGGFLAGLGTWLGAQSQGVDVPISTMVGAGLNVVPTAVVVLGLGAVMLSIAPRSAAVTVYVIIVGSLVIDLFGSLIASLHWLQYASLFHYMALVPAQSADAPSLVVNTAIGVILLGVATVMFRRRDLQGA